MDNKERIGTAYDRVILYCLVKIVLMENAPAEQWDESHREFLLEECRNWLQLRKEMLEPQE